MKTRITNLAAVGVLLWVLIAPTGSAFAPNLPTPLPDSKVELMVLIEDATACSQQADYDAANTEWSNGYNDEGLANFWTGIGLPNLLGYAGDGGHEASIQKCHKSRCTGGYMPVVSDFSWAGTSLVGYGASITVHSAEEKQPVVYSTCGGKALNFVTAQSRASTLEGVFAADATHGGILVPESQGEADLGADGVISTGAYSYHWSYAGEGNPASPITDRVPCDRLPHVCHAIGPVDDLVDVYGTGADQDTLT